MSTLRLYSAGTDSSSMMLYHAYVNNTVYSSDNVAMDFGTQDSNGNWVNSSITLTNTDGTTVQYEIVIQTFPDGSGAPIGYVDSNGASQAIEVKWERDYTVEEVVSAQSSLEPAIKDLRSDKLDIVQQMLTSAHSIKKMSVYSSDSTIATAVDSVLTTVRNMADMLGITTIVNRIDSNIEIQRADWDWFQREHLQKNPTVVEHIIDLVYSAVGSQYESFKQVSSDAFAANSVAMAQSNYNSTSASIIASQADLLREIVSSNKVASAALGTYEAGFKTAIASSDILTLAYNFGLPLDTNVISSDNTLILNVLTHMETYAATWQTIVNEYSTATAAESNDSTASYVSIALGLKNSNGENMNFDELLAAVGDLDNATQLADSIQAAISTRVSQLEKVMLPIVGTDATSGLINALMTTTSQLLSVLFGQPGYAADGVTVDTESSTGFIRIFIELGDLLKGVDYAFEHMTGTVRNDKLTKLLVTKVDALIDRLAGSI